MTRPIHAASAFLATLAFGLATAQAAAPVAELKVIGTLTVPTCTVASADDGVYDLGKISATMVKPATTTTLNNISKTWTVTCDAETYLNFRPVDNRAETNLGGDPVSFGLGSVNETGKIGFYSVIMKNGSVDSVASNVFSAANTSISSNTSVYISTTHRNGWSSGTSQKSGKIFVADLEIAPVLGSTSHMNGPITEDTNIDGSLTLNFAYGI